MKRKILVLVWIGALTMLFGCGNRGMATATGDGPTGGKVNKSDYNAAKVIESEELVYFTTEFYRTRDLTYDKDRNYKFTMTKSEDGGFTIIEGFTENLKCETDAEFADKLEKLIRDYDLIRLNGTYEYTQGLPEEYSPELLKAEYASGETLKFYVDGYPNEEWTGAVLDLFAKEFGAHGIEDLLPPGDDSIMTRFSLEYTFGDLRYTYGEIHVPIVEKEKHRSIEDLATNGFDEENYEKKAFASVWDRTGQTDPSEDRRAELSDAHYEALQKIVEETNLVSFHNGQIFPGGFDYENTPEYYEFYIEYKSGKVLGGFSDNPEDCERFKPVAEKFAQYYEAFLDGKTDYSDGSSNADESDTAVKYFSYRRSGGALNSFYSLLLQGDKLSVEKTEENGKIKEKSYTVPEDISKELNKIIGNSGMKEWNGDFPLNELFALDEETISVDITFSDGSSVRFSSSLSVPIEGWDAVSKAVALLETIVDK